MKTEDKKQTRDTNHHFKFRTDIRLIVSISLPVYNFKKHSIL